MSNRRGAGAVARHYYWAVVRGGGGVGKARSKAHSKARSRWRPRNATGEIYRQRVHLTTSANKVGPPPLPSGYPDESKQVSRRSVWKWAGKEQAPAGATRGAKV